MTLNFISKINKRSIQAVCGGISIVLMLTGCGQKGDLYMPDEANSNTDFILYKNIEDPSENKTSSSEETEVDVDIDSIKNDPNDY